MCVYCWLCANNGLMEKKKNKKLPGHYLADVTAEIQSKAAKFQLKVKHQPTFFNIITSFNCRLKGGALTAFASVKPHVEEQ